MGHIDDIARLDNELRLLEGELKKLKTQRNKATKTAVENGVTMYAIAKACGRTPSTVQRWVE